MWRRGRFPSSTRVRLTIPYYFDKPAEERAQPQAIHNSDRSVGAGLSGELMRRRSHAVGDDGEIVQAFDGSAGQSFGAFLAEGVTLKLNGEANDYVGKGLSGGTIALVGGFGGFAARRRARR